MKANIHPEYHAIKVIWTDGAETEMKSCWGKEGDVIRLDVDPKTHPAWVGGVHIKKTGQIERFSNRFKGMNFGGAAEEKKEEATDEKKDS